MVGFLFGLFHLVFTNNFFCFLLILSFSVPGFMMYLYKTSVYVEDLWFCMNDMNSMLMFLTVSLTLLIFLSSAGVTDTLYSTILLALMIVLVGSFMSNNVLWFYILFELSLLPILFLIIGWGYQPERLQAVVYMILYTVFGSMPLLIIILFQGYSYSSFNMYSLFMLVNAAPHWCVYLGFLAFLVKLPVWSLHVWLPKAHVEAPLGGSMILAGVLLKLGGYGMYIYNMLWISTMMNPAVVGMSCLAVWGGLCASVVCMSQSDIKAMIAYSSVVHMSIVVLGIGSNTVWGTVCALITMVAHGWVSSALFMCAYVTYQRTGSRSFTYSKGMLRLFPALGLSWFILTSVNMAAPPSINLIGELAAVPVAMWLNGALLAALVVTLFMSVAFNMYLYVKINHGPPGMSLISSSGCSPRALLGLFAHLLPLMLLFSLDSMSLYTENCM